MSQRQRAKTQGPSLMVAWQDIPWKKIHRHVFRLQKRIYRATADRKNKRPFGAGALRTTRRQPRLAQGMHARLAPGGQHPAARTGEGWGGAARFPLGLDTSHRTGYGRTAVQGLQSLTPEEKSHRLWENLEQLLGLEPAASRGWP